MKNFILTADTVSTQISPTLDDGGLMATATITGTVTFSGTPPKMKMIDSSMDPACVRNNGGMPLQSESLVLGPGQTMANVLVYVKDQPGQGNLLQNGAMSSEGAVIDQKGCRYIPHVVALQAGQKLRITNTDAIMHNVHALPISNSELTPPRGKPRGIRDAKGSLSYSLAYLAVNCEECASLGAFN